jgi:hypothetical protein
VDGPIEGSGVMNTKWPIHDIRHCCFPGSSLCGSVGKGYNAAKFFDRSFAQFTPGTTYFGETIPPFERPDRVKIALLLV